MLVIILRRISTLARTVTRITMLAETVALEEFEISDGTERQAQKNPYYTR